MESSNDRISRSSPISSLDNEPIKTTLEDVAAGVNRIENVLLDLTKQIAKLNENISEFLHQQQSTSSGKKNNLVRQVDVQQTEIKRSTSIRTYHKDSPDAIGNLTLQVATLSTSVAQLISQQQQQRNNII